MVGTGTGPPDVATVGESSEERNAEMKVSASALMLTLGITAGTIEGTEGTIGAG